MATVGNDRMIVRADHRDDGSWLFLVCYTACFTDTEVGLRFDDSLLVRPVHSLAQGGFGYESPVSFTARTPRVFRRKRIVVRAHDDNADAGLDTVCASIRLHRSGVGSVDDERSTPVWVPRLRARRDDRGSAHQLVPTALVRC